MVNNELFIRDTMTKLMLLTIVCCVLSEGVYSDDACKPPTKCMKTSQCTRLRRDANPDERPVLYPCNVGKVCCPPMSQVVANRLNYSVLPAECGLATTNKIIQGEDASLGQFPWMALIGVRTRTQTKISYICGGSLISRRFVLTAAHCVKDSSKTVVHVRLGEHNQSTVQDCEQITETEETCAPPVQDIPVDIIIVHHKYASATLKNDIALIRLKNLAALSEYVAPICLPLIVNDTGAENRIYTVAGWGKLYGLRTEESSPVLQFARVTGLATEECNELQPNVRLDDTQICADDTAGADACQGDSGGPLMDVRKSPMTNMSAYFVLGVVSFGFSGCDKQNSPSAYTRVHHYIDWMLQNMSN